METPREHHTGAPLLTRLRYRWNGDERMRCFHIVGGEPVAADCPPKFTGLGDVIADGTKALGVKPCGKCRKRQAWLNRVTPGWMKKFLSWVKSL
jgi:hypothetical protein